MNMHGIIEPARTDFIEREPFAVRALAWLRRKRMLLLIVVLPTLLVAGYLFLIASDQYESEAHFLVRNNEPTPAPVSGFGALLSSAAGIGNSQTEAMSVADYLTSHDVVATLRRNDQLVERFHRDDVDLLSRLRNGDPAPETLLRYYRKQIKVRFDPDTGITTLTVHSFKPEDSYQLARKLLELGEQRVNVLNERSYHDAIAMAQTQLFQAERAAEENQVRMTGFRQQRSDIDPQAQGQSQLTLVSQLTGQLASARAQLAMMGGMVSHSSPQYIAVVSRERALAAQVAAQQSRLTGSDKAIANDIGGYENLKMRQEFLAKQYETAAAALQSARETAQRQQLYVVQVVDANMPVKSLFPQRWRLLATVVVVLLLAYSIGWLIAAGVREHTN
jgi:capsular polysaccharide transport system permease protein